jgi:hypothetical protein
MDGHAGDTRGQYGHDQRGKEHGSTAHVGGSLGAGVRESGDPPAAFGQPLRDSGPCRMALMWYPPLAGVRSTW